MINLAKETQGWGICILCVWTRQTWTNSEYKSVFCIYDQTDDTLRDVTFDQLHHITKFRVRDLVVLTNWLGRVYFVSCDIVLRFEDEIPLRTFRDGVGLKPPQSDWDITGELCPPYLWQELWALACRRSCTVTKVFDTYVLVNWIASCDNNNSPDTQPSDTPLVNKVLIVWLDSLSPPI